MSENALLHHIVERLATVNGIVAVVLGGSRATGTHRAESDYDLGLFYRGSDGFDLLALQRVATELDDEHRADVVTPIGGWGPWVVGGGWLHIEGSPVDFIYRDIERVAQVIDDCRKGNIDIAYQPAYTVGYLTVTYVAEVDACQVLWDPSGDVERLKHLTQPYPDALKQAILGKFAWVLEFAIGAGRKTAARADVAFASSCVYWDVIAMCHILFALNGHYCLNEKGAVALVDTFPIRPERWRARVEAAFEKLRASAPAIDAAFDELASLVADVRRLL